MLTSIHNPRVKQAIKLRDRKGRSRQGRFLIDGAREISRAAAAGWKLLEVFICEDFIRADETRAALAEAGKNGAEIVAVSPAVMEKLAYGNRREGLLAVAEARVRTLDDIELPPNPLVGVIVGLEKPGNVGAVLRSADGAGVDAVIVADGRCDLFNANAIRASLGTLFTLPFAEASSAAALAWLRARGIHTFAARVDGARDYAANDYRAATAIVLGSEAEGLSSAWRANDVTAISLPMRGQADSLNVAAAAAVLFYEARRQRA